jgi:hypothetical protein
MFRQQVPSRTGVATYSSTIPFKLAPYHPQGNFLPLFFHRCVLSKSLKVKIYKTIIILVPVGSYGSGAWYFSLRKEHRLRCEICGSHDGTDEENCLLEREGIIRFRRANTLVRTGVFQRFPSRVPINILI